MSVIGPGMAAWEGSAAMEGAQHAFTISDTPNEKTYHTMKPMISTRIAAAAFTSLHASDRNEYHNSLLAKAGARPAANTVEKTSRDEYYASLLASMQNKGWSKQAASKARNSLSPPLMRSTMHTPTKGRDSTAMSSAIAVAAITTFCRSRRIAAN